MEIEKIVSNVQTKVGNTDFSAQTIQKACELFPVAEGAEPDEAYFTKVANFVIGMQGQYNHDFSVKFTEAKKNLLTEDTFKDMSAEQIAEIRKLVEGFKPKESPDENKEVETLKEQIRLLNERLNDGDKAKKQAELLQQVKLAMKEQKADDEYVLDNTLRGVELDDKKSIKDLTEEYLAKYDAEYTKCRGAGALPRQGIGGGGKGKTLLDEMWEKRHPKKQ